MPRIFITVICAWWATGFALRAAETAGLADGRLPGALSAETFAAAACTLVAVLFLWVAVSSLAGTGRDLSDVAAVAASAAAVTLATGGFGDQAAPTVQLSGEPGIYIVALCATWLSVREAEKRLSAPAAIRPSEARRLAEGAAHGTMLGRLSRRGGPETAGGEV